MDQDDYEFEGQQPIEDAGEQQQPDRFEERLGQITTAIEQLTRRQEESTRRQEENARLAERQQLEGRIAAYGQRLSGDLAAAEREVETTERALTAAHEEGEASAIARAHRAMTEAIAKRESTRAKLEEHRAARSRFEASRQRQPENPPPDQAARGRNDNSGGEGDTTNLENWKDRNSAWYGVDPEMTTAAHEIDQQIRSAGVIPVGSERYFEAIDRQMQRRYPDRLGRSPNTAGGGGRSGAPAGGPGGGPGGGRIPASVIDSWRKMGIEVENPEVIQRMIGHRETAVRKGLLPSRPVYERVRT
jgi:hypothetical protein